MAETVCGIILECNPFHNGHAHVIRAAKQKTGAAFVIAVMSGDFVQRGEPAIIDKERRARCVLEAGADLVLELPLSAATGSAAYFADGAVGVLDRLGIVTDLAFGSESGSTETVLTAGRAVLKTAENDPAYHAAILAATRAGLSFPAARAQAAKNVYGVSLPDTPNDLLASEYAAAAMKRGASFRFTAIPRIPAVSAADLRARLLLNRSGGITPADRAYLSSAVPDYALDTLLSDSPLLSMDDFSEALFFALLEHQGTLEDYADISADLANRIRNLLPTYRSAERFAAELKTRDRALGRIRRSLIHVLLGIREADYAVYTEGRSGKSSLPVRVLGLRKSAASVLLPAIREKGSVTLITRPASEVKDLDPPAAALYRKQADAAFLYDCTAARLAKDPEPVRTDAEKELVFTVLSPPGNR